MSMMSIPPYPKLTDKLLNAEKHPDLQDRVVAHVLATLAGYAYSDVDTVAKMAARLGLDGSRCLEVREYVDVMFIDSTAYLIQSRDGRVVILVYRGTTPDSLINWLTDIEVDPQKVKIRFDRKFHSVTVHRGYYRNVCATFVDVIAAIRRAMNKQSVTLDEHGGSEPVENAMQALYITGHSLGAAMAALTTVILHTDKQYKDIVDKLKHVYTFGQPMIGDRALAAHCGKDTKIGGSLTRFVFGRDAAPQLPPTASGTFAHFGQQCSHRSNESPGGWRETGDTKQMRNLLELAVLVPSFLLRQVKFTRQHVHFGASVDDHLPWHYIATLQPDNVKTEFGGDGLGPDPGGPPASRTESARSRDGAEPRPPGTDRPELQPVIA
jgi:hypothetical protein